MKLTHLKMMKTQIYLKNSLRKTYSCMKRYENGYDLTNDQSYNKWKALREAKWLVTEEGGCSAHI